MLCGVAWGEEEKVLKRKKENAKFQAPTSYISIM